MKKKKCISGLLSITSPLMHTCTYSRWNLFRSGWHLFDLLWLSFGFFGLVLYLLAYLWLSLTKIGVLACGQASLATLGDTLLL